ncbi:MAG TPA: hypothetical protein VL068_06510 [Microthrixaceae bacterium]|nr:hypothetical protein [Microthrixaceae bacterium]
MNENNVRINEFKTEIEGLKLRGSSSEGEKRLLVLGVLLAVGGVLLAIGGAIQVASFGDSPGDQRAVLAQGSFLGIALIIAGAALFIRFSLARYMRFWMIRLTYESRANTDRIVDAIERGSGIQKTTSVGQEQAAADLPGSGV